MLFVHTVNFELPTAGWQLLSLPIKKPGRRAEFLGRRHRLPDGKNNLSKNQLPQMEIKSCKSIALPMAVLYTEHN